jgi:hypothetical protein
MEFTQGHEKYAEKCVAMALSNRDLLPNFPPVIS